MCSNLQESICSCKKLRMLYISTGLVPGLCCSTGDAVSTFCLQLPQLRTLQWRMATCGPERPNHFSPAFVARVAAHVPIGLQLLQVRRYFVLLHTRCRIFGVPQSLWRSMVFLLRLPVAERTLYI